VEEVLRDAPNVMVQETYFGPVIDLRGNGERAISRVKVLVDGIGINPIDESMGTLPINTIPVNSIERIEIIPGGGAVLNGSGTAGGVVNVITKSTARKNYFTSSYGNMSYDTNKASFGGGYNITDRLYMNMGYSYLKGNGYRNGDDREEGSFTGGFDYKISDRQRIRIQGTKFRGNQDTSNPISKELLAQNRKAAGFPVESNSDRESYSLDHEFKVNDKFTVLTTLYDQRYKRNFVENSVMDYEMGRMVIPNMNAQMDGRFDEKSKGAKIRGKYIYDRGELVLGYDYNKTKLKRSSLITATGKYLSIIPIKVAVDVYNDVYKVTNGFYGLNRYNLTEKLQLTTGLRYEYSKFGGNRMSYTKINIPIPIPQPAPKKSAEDRISDNFAGEIGLNYSYSDTGSIYTRYERGFISPMPGQITDKDQKGEYKPNNLKSETSDTLEVGVKDFIGNSFLSWSVFTTFTEDEISLIQGSVHNPATKWWSYKNLGKTRRIGTELFAEQYFGNLTLNQGITYVNTKITKGDYKGDKVPMAPEGKLTLGANYKVTEKLTSGVTFNYVGKSTVREFDKKDNTFKTNISGYHFTDLTVQYKVNEYFTVSGGINNIFNNNYNYSETRDSAIPAPGRNYYLSGAISL
ncbi:MAG: TonB-dependent receptor, partial [Cetobacterium sp.]|nr:TonB-dependent receptor [Cetobacterium sp.]